MRRETKHSGMILKFTIFLHLSKHLVKIFSVNNCEFNLAACFASRGGIFALFIGDDIFAFPAIFYWLIIGINANPKFHAATFAEQFNLAPISQAKQFGGSFRQKPSEHLYFLFKVPLQGTI